MKLSSIFFLLIVFISSCATPVPVTSTENAAATIIPTSTDSPISTPIPTSSSSSHLEPFGLVRISAAETSFNVNGDGMNVDSISFWEASDPTQTLMFVTSKDNASIEVYQYPFKVQTQTISCGRASNGVWVDQDRNVLYITERDSSNVCAYELPDLNANASLSFRTAATRGGSEPNLAMLHLPDGQRRIYISYDDRVYFHDAETGDSLGEFEPMEGLETMYGDDYYQVLYIPDENDRSGIYVYNPDGNSAGSKFADRSIFDSDAEGIWVYKCFASTGTDNGEGLIVVADQKDELTDFELFHRNTKAHLGTIHIDGVNNTDGIAITQQSFPDYPLGLLAVIDDDTSTVGVGWNTILEKTGLSCGG
ncbi:MAG TPA: phytase [Anaerolineales bacterium]|nr:phytase [Anaerolineales bacterium]